MLPTGSIVRALYHKLQTQSSAPENGRNYRPKQVELIEIINKPLLLHLVGYLYYWQMGFNSVFKGLRVSGAILLLLPYTFVVWTGFNLPLLSFSILCTHMF